ncbi:MAG: hypothetical protein SFV15_06380 [Polyangiaceae bacterium]|nr:hypothetical protein [Polyangiaceae bacterium]
MPLGSHTSGRFRQCIATLALALSGCRAPTPGSIVSEPGLFSQETHRFQDRPSLYVIERQGDPLSAVSFVVGHGLDAIQASALVSWLEQRTRREGLPRVRVFKSGSELRIEALVSSGIEATRFVTFVDSSLREPGVSPWFQPEVLTELLSSVPQITANTAAASVAQCAGEPYVSKGHASQPLTDSEVALLRDRVLKQPSAFAAVGSAEIVDAVRMAVKALPARSTEVVPAIRAERALTVLPSGARGSRLRVAWFAPQLGAVSAVEEGMLDGRGALTARLAGLPASWELGPVSIRPVPGGACLLVNWLTPEFVSMDQAAFALRALYESFSDFARQPHDSDSPWESTPPEPDDPREIASAAAWRLVTEASPPSDAGMAAVLEVTASRFTPPVPQEYPLDALLERLQARPTATRLELRNRVELGQPEFWMLVGSPCSERPKSAANAAAEALWLRTLTSQVPNLNGVTVEPWISTTGLGLLGHARRRNPRESHESLASRVAASLGRVLAATQLNAEVVRIARSRLLSGLRRSNPAGFWWMLDELSAGQPWRLSGHTTPEILSDLALGPVARHRSLFLAGPLRIATLSNLDPSQGQTAVNTFDEWASPYASDPLKCEGPEAPNWDFGEHRMLGIGVGEPAYVLVPFAPQLDAGVRLVSVLINRGLARTFESDVDGSKAEAELFENPTGTSIVVRVTAPEAELIRAVARVRASLENMAEGGASARDLEWAQQRAEALDQMRRLDPRVRIAELWAERGARAANLGDLQTALRGLGPERQMVALPPAKNP